MVRRSAGFSMTKKALIQFRTILYRTAWALVNTFWSGSFLIFPTDSSMLYLMESNLLRSQSFQVSHKVLSSVLYSFLYTLMMQWMKNWTVTHTILYADDILLYRIISNSDDYDKLQADVNTLSTWVTSNNLYLNTAKCKFMIISRLRK